MRIIAGEARGRPLRAPRGRSTRPPLDQTRGSIFAMLDVKLGDPDGERGPGAAVEGRAVLDLFAGAGAFGLEAVSRGAAEATFVENDAAALEALQRNIRELGFGGRARVIRGDALRFQPEPGGPEVVFVDPPFALLDAPSKAARLVELVERLLAALPGDGILLLRLPSGREAAVGEATSRPPADQRKFGASTVLFYERP